MTGVCCVVVPKDVERALRGHLGDAVDGRATDALEALTEMDQEQVESTLDDDRYTQVHIASASTSPSTPRRQGELGRHVRNHVHWAPLVAIATADSHSALQSPPLFSPSNPLVPREARDVLGDGMLGEGGGGILGETRGEIVRVAGGEIERVAGGEIARVAGSGDLGAPGAGDGDVLGTFGGNVLGEGAISLGSGNGAMEQNASALATLPNFAPNRHTPAPQPPLDLRAPTPVTRDRERMEPATSLPDISVTGGHTIASMPISTISSISPISPISTSSAASSSTASTASLLVREPCPIHNPQAHWNKQHLALNLAALLQTLLCRIEAAAPMAASTGLPAENATLIAHGENGNLTHLARAEDRYLATAGNRNLATSGNINLATMGNGNLACMESRSLPTRENPALASTEVEENMYELVDEEGPLEGAEWPIEPTHFGNAQHVHACSPSSSTSTTSTTSSNGGP